MTCLEIESVLSSVILAFLPTVLPLVMVIMLLDFNVDFSIFSVGLVPLDVGFAPLVVGFVPLVIGFVPLVIGLVPLVVGFEPLVVGLDKGCLEEVVVGTDLVVVVEDLSEIEDTLEVIFFGRNGTPLCLAVALVSVDLVAAEVGFAVGLSVLEVAIKGFVVVGFDVADALVDAVVGLVVDVVCFDTVLLGVVGFDGLFVVATFLAEGTGTDLLVAGIEFLLGAAIGLVVVEDMLGVDDFFTTSNGLPS